MAPLRRGVPLRPHAGTQRVGARLCAGRAAPRSRAVAQAGSRAAPHRHHVRRAGVATVNPPGIMVSDWKARSSERCADSSQQACRLASSCMSSCCIIGTALGGSAFPANQCWRQTAPHCAMTVARSVIQRRSSRSPAVRHGIASSNRCWRHCARPSRRCSTAERALDMSARSRDPAALRAQPKRNGSDFWPTPRCLTRALIEHVLPDLPRAPIWECAAGDGRVAESMRTAGYSVFASDIEPRGEGIERRDFLRNEPPHLGLIAVTNSPFGKHLTLFITRGLRLLDQGHIEGLVLLVRHDALMAQERVDALTAPHRSCTAVGARCGSKAAAATPAGPALGSPGSRATRAPLQCVGSCLNRSGGRPPCHSTHSSVPQHTRSNTMPLDNTPKPSFHNADGSPTRPTVRCACRSNSATITPCC